MNKIQRWLNENKFDPECDILVVGGIYRVMPTKGIKKISIEHFNGIAIIRTYVKDEIPVQKALPFLVQE